MPKNYLIPVAATILSFGASAYAQDASPETPLQALPYVPSLDVTAMDRAVDPCDDLYTYACGSWQKTNPIPADQSAWSVYGKLSADNQRYLWGILEDASKPRVDRTGSQQRIGDYFASCMDTAAIESAGARPVEPWLTRIDALSSKRALAALLGELHRSTSDNGLFFASAVEQDAKDASQVIAALDAGGLGLPDRDYYLKTDAKSIETRERYLEHVTRTFVLLAESPAVAAQDARTVMRIETALARASLTRVQRRDPHKVYHRRTLAGLEKIAPRFDWEAYFSAAGLASRPWLNVEQVGFFKEFNARLAFEKLADLKTYLRWAVASAASPYLSAAFVNENFSFYKAYLHGVKQDRPRWKKCVAWVDRDLGEALGQEYVRRAFPESARVRTVRMTEQIEAAMKRRIELLDWMSPKTKSEALAKLAAVRNKIGYPLAWRDYSALPIGPGNFFANVTRAIEFESHRQAAKIGKPVDRDEWGMTPPTVNAEYNPSLNDINFPAGVLLPPLFDPNIDDAPNYGDTGGTIGHELTHGFDDEGRQFDGKGNLRDWWTREDAKEFEQRAQCVRDQYSGYTVIDDVKINGALTSGEDIADLGGEIIAWMAWKEATRDLKLEVRDGLTPEQRFFVGFAQWACANERPEDLRVKAVIDPHSPPRYRINGVVANMPEFARAFHCRAGRPLVKNPGEICRVW